MADKVVKVQAGKKVVNVKMETNATALADVVVMAAIRLCPKNGNRILFCDFRESTKGNETDVLSRIEGPVAGINKTSSNSNDVVIREYYYLYGKYKAIVCS